MSDIKKRMGYALLLMLKKLYTDDNGCPHNTAPVSADRAARRRLQPKTPFSLQWTPATPPDGCKVDFYNILRNDTVVGHFPNRRGTWTAACRNRPPTVRQ